MGDGPVGTTPHTTATGTNPLIIEREPDRVWALLPPEPAAPGGTGTGPTGDPAAPGGGQPAGGGPGTPGGPGTGAAGGPDAPRTVPPRDIAIDILERVALPDGQVRMSPETGLVALPAWFWLDGYDGRVLSGARTVEVPAGIGADVPLSIVPAADPRRQPGTLSVEVRVWPAAFEWDFGDGARMASTSPGRAYPAESDVRHTYERSSLGAGAGFPVRLTIEFAAAYAVNGGPPQALASVRRTYAASYRVEEAQAVLTGR